jgi:hypothetical protein
MVFFRDNNSWTNRNAFYISDGKMDFDPELVERLKRRKWDIKLQVSTIEDAWKAMNHPEQSLIIIDDTAKMPAPYVLRNLLIHPLAYMTPIITLLREDNGKEKPGILSLTTMEIIDKPIVPAKFVDSFEWVIQRWTSGFMKELREAGNDYRMGNKSACIHALTKLAAPGESSPPASACLSLLLSEAKDFKAAERILLAAIKTAPRNLGIILPLVHLYLRNAMPELALRLLKGVTFAYGTPKILALDNIQSHLMLGQITECLPYLEDMVASDYLADSVRPILSKLLYADGHIRAFEKSIGTHSPLIDQFVGLWGKHQLTHASKAS